LRAFCLSVTGFTNPPISQTLTFDHGKQLVVALGVGDAKSGAAIVAEIEFRQVAVKMGFTAMLVDANHAAFEDRKYVLNRVRMDRLFALVANVFALRMIGRLVRGVFLAGARVEARGVGVERRGAVTLGLSNI